MLNVVNEARFRVSDIVAHPTFGLCQIRKVTRIEMNGHLEPCYVLSGGALHHSMKVFIPIAQAEANGLRSPITKRETEEIFQIFQGTDEALEERSHQQPDEHWHCISHSDNLFQVAKAVRALLATGTYVWSEETERIDISHPQSEERLLRCALGRLIAELAFVQGVSRQQIGQRIRECLRKNRKSRKVQATKN